jgi:hypothetical protein
VDQVEVDEQQVIVNDVRVPDLLVGRASHSVLLRGASDETLSAKKPYSAGMSDAKQPPSLVRRWEGLDMGLQFLIAWPTLTVIISIIHLAALNQPLWRSLLYGVFWALPASFLVAMASQNEARKRREAARQDAGPSTDA